MVSFKSCSFSRGSDQGNKSIPSCEVQKTSSSIHFQIYGFEMLLFRAFFSTNTFHIFGDFENPLAGCRNGFPDLILRLADFLLIGSGIARLQTKAARFVGSRMQQQNVYQGATSLDSTASKDAYCMILL